MPMNLAAIEPPHDVVKIWVEVPYIVQAAGGATMAILKFRDNWNFLVKEVKWEKGRRKEIVWLLLHRKEYKLLEVKFSF